MLSAKAREDGGLLHAHILEVVGRAGLEVVEGHEHLETFVDINSRNMHRLGTPAHGLNFFRNIVNVVVQPRLLIIKLESTVAEEPDSM